MKALLGLLLACGCRPGGTGDDGSSDTGSGTLVGQPEPCLWQPCVADRADAEATGGVQAGRFGVAIAVLDGPDAVAAVGSGAGYRAKYVDIAEAAALTLPELSRERVWASDNAFDNATEAMALRADPTGGYVLAVGASLGYGYIGRPGAVYLLRDDAPAGNSLQSAAYATISGDGAGFSAGGQINLGIDLRWLDLTGTGTSELVVAASGTPPLPGDTVADGAAIYAFDAGITGSLDVFDADRRITSPVAYFGGHIDGWDGDADGIVDLVATQLFNDGSEDRVLAFASPWLGDLTVDDATAAWTLGASSEVDAVVGLGDVTGDGAPDLFTGLNTWSGDGVERAGAGWVLAGGSLTGGSLLDAPIRFLGDEAGEGCGSAAASGDFDGDGAQDLVIGCQGLGPAALPGKVVLFLGPLAEGALDESRADAVVHGEYAFDWFGMTLASLDIEPDGISELLVGAPGAEAGVGRVYLLRGDSLVP